MLPSKHIILGLLFSLLILMLFPNIGFSGFLIIFLSSFLIDVDHYLLYAFIKRDISLKRARKWFYENYLKILALPTKERRNLKSRPFILHGIEAILILILLSYYSPVFFYILIGFLFHQFLDLLTLIYFSIPLHKLGSQTYNILNHHRWHKD